VLTAAGSRERSVLIPSFFPLSSVRRGSVVILLRRSFIFSCFLVGQSYQGYNLHCVTVWVCLCVVFVGMCCGAHDGVDLSVGACIGRFSYRSVSRSVGRGSVGVARVTDVTARPLLQC